jgi:hypothetical protein
MKTKLTNSIAKGHVGYGAGPGLSSSLNMSAHAEKVKS